MISRLENERSYLDAFARRGVGRAVWVIKRGMRGEARASVVLGVVALQQDCFVTFQSREIVPAMCRVVGEAVGFAHPLAIDQITGHDILRTQAAGVAQRERRTFDRAANRAPDVYFGEAILERDRLPPAEHRGRGAA